MTEAIRIIAAVVDKQQLTLYKGDGSSIIILQGDPRIHTLVDRVVPELEANGFCDLDTLEISTAGFYEEAEKSMGGLIKFFRAAKQTIDNILNQFTSMEKPVEEMVVGEVPGIQQQQEENTAENRSVTKSQAAVAEIMAQAAPAGSTEFEAQNDQDSTVVAVLQDGTVIPGVENISIQLQGLALKLGSPQGVVKFFERIASVQRAHSVQDLLTFMSKGELPIADDGSVLVYKRLKSTSVEGVFVDCHTGKVKQRVGSMVFMKESMVDPNRSQDCSNGLHVARRDYLSSFSGDVTVLAKLAPEDVIAVPHRDARKLRAKGYHIVARLSDEDAKLVCSNRPMADTKLLGNVAAGHHVGILETVEITGQQGAGLFITAVAEAEELVDSGREAESLDSIQETEEANKTVDAESVAKTLVKAKSTGKSSRQVKAEELFEAVKNAETSEEAQTAGKALLEYKKRAKVGWGALGLANDIPERIEKGIAKLKAAESLPKTKPVKADKVPVSKPAAGAKPAPKGSPRERIAAAIKGGITKAKAAEAVAIKKASKKSWVALGLTAKQVNEIERLAK